MGHAFSSRSNVLLCVNLIIKHVDRYLFVKVQNAPVRKFTYKTRWTMPVRQGPKCFFYLNVLKMMGHAPSSRSNVLIYENFRVQHDEPCFFVRVQNDFLRKFTCKTRWAMLLRQNPRCFST